MWILGESQGTGERAAARLRGKSELTTMNDARCDGLGHSLLAGLEYSHDLEGQ
jgi:hypothetical protein